MKIVDMPRGTGKTYQLARLSKETGYPVVVMDDTLAYLFNKDYPDSKFISLQNFLENQSEYDNIYIDDINVILQKLFPNTKIRVMTYSSEDNNSIGYQKGTGNLFVLCEYDQKN